MASKSRISELEFPTKGDSMSDMAGFQTIPDFYGENVFSSKTMRNYLSEKTYK